VNDFYSWGSPLVANRKVYIGSSADCGNPHVAAGVFAYNQSSGNQIASWSSLPLGDVGASIWSSVGLATNGSILVTTGSSCDSCGPPLPLYDESIVRLDPTTLKLRDAWQLPAAQQSFDSDFGGSPTTFTATIGGVATPMVGACNKNGNYYALNQDDLAAGPVWQDVITEPYRYDPGKAEECDAAAIWNGTDLIEGGGAPTTIGGINYTGSVQALNPATGAPIWQTGLPGTVVGSPTEDGAGVVAAQTFYSKGKELGVYLLNASTGAIISFIPTPNSSLFGQAVFAGEDLLVGESHHLGLNDYAVPSTLPTLASAGPSQVSTGSAGSVTFTGTGFQSGATLRFSGPSTTVTANIQKIAPTTMKATVTVPTGAATGAYVVTVTNPDGGVGTCATCFAVIAGT
jgi:outer membrane protein assembly factor BamB